MAAILAGLVRHFLRVAGCQRYVRLVFLSPQANSVILGYFSP